MKSVHADQHTHHSFIIILHMALYYFTEINATQID